MVESFFDKTIAAYLETDCKTKLQDVKDKAKVIGYTRLIRRAIRRGELNTEKGRANIELWKKELISLLEEVYSLAFEANELEIKAKVENLPEVLCFINGYLDRLGCSVQNRMQFEVIAEECFVNIAMYAYAPEEGRALIRVKTEMNPPAVEVTFMDRGMQFDPLARKDPDVTLSAEDRGIGGLGIYMTKQMMDLVTYEYKDGRNILRIKKTF